jgi:hypothetical protein
MVAAEAEATSRDHQHPGLENLGVYFLKRTGFRDPKPSLCLHHCDFLVLALGQAPGSSKEAHRLGGKEADLETGQAIVVEVVEAEEILVLDAAVLVDQF